MARNFSNAPTDQSLEQIVTYINTHRYAYPYVSHIGLEVEGLNHRSGERRTLTPTYDSLGFAPRVGDEIECSGMGLGSLWRVVAVAEGYPGQMQVRR